MSNEKGSGHAARLPKNLDTTRVHLVVPLDWLKDIERAAAKRSFSRSSYICRVAYEQAKLDLLGKAAK